MLWPMALSDSNNSNNNKYFTQDRNERPQCIWIYHHGSVLIACPCAGRDTVVVTRLCVVWRHLAVKTNRHDRWRHLCNNNNMLIDSDIKYNNIVIVDNDFITALLTRNPCECYFIIFEPIRCGTYRKVCRRQPYTMVLQSSA